MATETPEQQRVMVKEMSWDPITRIVGSLGIHTEIDFANQQVLKCYSTSMIFRGFDIFMKGIDPRDAHFITSRICGICGDNHCTCTLRRRWRSRMDTEQLVGRVQDLQARLESSNATATRELAEELVSAVVQMYGAGLERILASLIEAGPEGERIAASLPDDPLVATLLLIHDLHPVPLEHRVQQALDSVRPYMESHGGNVELLSLEHGVARIHLRGSCSDCSASSVTLELAIKRALEDAAPDLEGLEVEGMSARTAGRAGGPESMWIDLESVSELADGSLAPVSVAGRELLVANVDGSLLAYRDRCASCGARLRDGLLMAGALSCPECARSFFLPRAGRSMDDDRLQLEPVPLLREDGRVRVALTR
jgi:Fe-S cluster biogenesis protein NfuA/nitrite reductase/ring-hydroxylating ferredoxin subunit